MDGEEGVGTDKFLEDIEPKSDAFGEAGVIGGPSRLLGSLSEDLIGEEDR